MPGVRSRFGKIDIVKHSETIIVRLEHLARMIDTHRNWWPDQEHDPRFPLFFFGNFGILSAEDNPATCDEKHNMICTLTYTNIVNMYV